MDIEIRLDFDESAFSPPENDDSFLYIRYPQAVANKLKSPASSRKNSNTSTSIGNFEVDLVNHTGPCKQYILQSGYQPSASLKKTPDVKIKSNGTDDGFKGEGAACGSSIVRVAHQMVSKKLVNNTAAVNEDPLRPKGFNSSKRRGSRSLPVSPMSSPPGSPNSRRRLTNKYFTGPFVDNENHGGSWILQGLLSRRDVSQSVGFIAEESTKGELEKAISDLHIHQEPKLERKVKKEFKAKPSEFRELNFWSPTSM